MKIEIETSAYNERRYGKPYIASIIFEDNKGEPTWGNWVGDSRNGTSGLLTIEVDPGDVVMKGQRDNRNMRNSAPEYAIVQSDGSLEDVSKVEAYQHFQTVRPATPKENPLSEFSDDQIRLEFARRGL